MDFTVSYFTLMQLDSVIKHLVAYSLQQTLGLASHGEIHQPSLLDTVQVVIQHLHSSLPLDEGQLELWLLQGTQVLASELTHRTFSPSYKSIYH